MVKAPAVNTRPWNPVTWCSCDPRKIFARIHRNQPEEARHVGPHLANKEDYNKIQEDDVIDITGLTTFAPETPLTIVLHHSNGTKNPSR